MEPCPLLSSSLWLSSMFRRLLSLSSADHTEIGEVAKGLADRYDGTNVSLSLPSTRVDAFNITLANEFSRSHQHPLLCTMEKNSGGN